MTRFLSILLVFLTTAVSIQAGTISVMSYNVENLFDLENDPRTNDDEFTPEGRAEWTAEKLVQKLQHLTQVVKSVRNSNGSRCPDVLGLVEVENREILEYWRTHFLGECQYRQLVINRHYEDQPIEDDRRGIKVALLSKLKLAGQPATYLPTQGGRYILEVPLELNGRYLVALVNHWKSRSGGGEEKRIEAAKVLRHRFEFWNQHHPYYDVIAMGDFNDEPENESFTKALLVNDRIEDVELNLEQAFIWNTSFDEMHLERRLEEARELQRQGHPIDLEEVERYWRRMRGTYYFSRDNRFNQLDHILISRGLLQRAGFYYEARSFKVVRPAKFTTPEGYPIPYRPEPGGATGGASDHFPVIVTLRYDD